MSDALRRCHSVRTLKGRHYRCQQLAGHTGEHSHVPEEVVWEWSDQNAVMSAMYAPDDGYPNGVAATYDPDNYPDPQNAS